MKKSAIWMLLFVLLTAGTNAFAITPDEAAKMRYEEVKRIKQAQREARKNNPNPAPSKMDEFWKKEGERSGLSQWGGGVGNVVRGLNPVPFFKNQKAQYEARKAAGTK